MTDFEYRPADRRDGPEWLCMELYPRLPPQAGSGSETSPAQAHGLRGGGLLLLLLAEYLSAVPAPCGTACTDKGTGCDGSTGPLPR